jgi:hypothetical protein
VRTLFVDLEGLLFLLLALFSLFPPPRMKSMFGAVVVHASSLNLNRQDDGDVGKTRCGCGCGARV